MAINGVVGGDGDYDDPNDPNPIATGLARGFQGKSRPGGHQPPLRVAAGGDGGDFDPPPPGRQFVIKGPKDYGYTVKHGPQPPKVTQYRRRYYDPGGDDDGGSFGDGGDDPMSEHFDPNRPPSEPRGWPRGDSSIGVPDGASDLVTDASDPAGEPAPTHEHTTLGLAGSFVTVCSIFPEGSTSPG